MFLRSTAAPFRKLCLALFYVGICTFVTSLWLMRDKKLTNCKGPVSFQTIESNTTRRPFAYRALAPIMVRTAHVISKPARVRVAQSLKRHLAGFADYMQHTCTSDEHAIDLLVLTGFILLCFLAMMLTVRGMFSYLFESSTWMHELAGPLAALTVTQFFNGGGHVFYDPPSFVLVPLSIFLMAQRRWGLFYVTLAVGFINKETACLVSLAFALYCVNEMSRRSLLKHLAFQLGLYTLLRIAVVFFLDPHTPAAADNNSLRDYLARNLVSLWHARFWLDYVAQAALLALAVLLFRNFGIQPRLLRRSSVLALPLAAGYFKGGRWGEVRVFYEVFPLFFLLGYRNLLDLLGHNVKVRAEQRGNVLLGPTARSSAWHCLMLGIGVLFVGSAIAAYKKMFL